MRMRCLRYSATRWGMIMSMLLGAGLCRSALFVEITEKLRANRSIDWFKRDEVRSKLRLLVRSALRRHKYPPDKREEAIDLVLKQAEVLCDDWE